MLLRAGRATFDVDGIVFDKDGTLISLDSWLQPSSQWIDEAAAGDEHLAAVLRATLGLTVGPKGISLAPDGPLATASLEELVILTQRVLESAGVRGAAERAESARTRATLLNATLIPDPIGDVLETMTRLAKAGFQLAVATTDDLAATMNALGRLGIAELIGVVVAAGGAIPSKPHPAVLTSIAAGWRTSTSRLLMVGDSRRDADTAHAAGAAGFVLVSENERAGIAADAVIRSIEDLHAD